MAKNNKRSGMTVEEAGHKGGQRVSELVKEGKEKEREGGPGSTERHEPHGSRRNNK
jgi:hypothetical protein